MSGLKFKERLRWPYCCSPVGRPVRRSGRVREHHRDVSDPSGATVPNAAVVILDLDRGVSYQATTNASGNFEQTHLSCRALQGDNYRIWIRTVYGYGGCSD